MRHVHERPRRATRWFDCAILSILLLAPSSTRADPTWVNLSRDRGSIDDIEVDRVDPALVYAVAAGALFSSPDRGASWAPVEPVLAVGVATSLVAHPSGRGHVFMGTSSSGIFRSLDGGLSWTPARSGLDTAGSGSYPRVEVIVVDPVVPTTLYAGTTLGVFRSRNLGASWALTGLAGYAGSLSAVGTDATVLYATANGDVYRSDDSGSTWSRRSQGLPSVSHVVGHPLEPDTVYAAQNGVYRSDDGGNSWALVGTAATNSLNTWAVSDLALDPLNPGIVLAATLGGRRVARSLDGGQTWSPFNTGLPNSAFRTNALALGADPNGRLYLATDDGLYRTNSATASWARASGLFAENAVMVATSTEPSSVAVISGGGEVRLLQPGPTPVWTNLPQLRRGDANAMLFMPVATGSASGVLYADSGCSGMWRLTIPGGNWIDMSDGLPSSARCVNSIVPGQLGTADIFVATSSGVFYSAGNGPFVPRSTGLPAGSVSALVRGSGATPPMLALRGGVLYRSTDDGLTWQPGGTGLPTGTGKRVWTLAVPPSSADVVYAGTSQDGVYRSTDGGVTWSAARNGLPRDPGTGITKDIAALLATSPLRVYAWVLEMGLFLTDDGGDTWQRYSDGLPPHAAVRALAQLSSGALVAAADNGPYTTDGPRPTITGITPTSGWLAGGTRVRLATRWASLRDTPFSATIGGIPAISTQLLGNDIEITTPSLPGAGTHPITVTLGSIGMTAPVPFTALSPATGDDSDGDTLPDLWELAFGLDPLVASASGDADGDGSSDAAEYARGTHPSATHRRYFAEGASGSFFDLAYAIFNPTASDSYVGLQLYTGDGRTVPYMLHVPAMSRRTVRGSDIPGLGTAEYSALVESDEPIVAERTMTWGETRYGSHADVSAAKPSPIWYIAEGATHSNFELFYLIQNPNTWSVSANVTYLLPAPAQSLRRTYSIPPTSRFTIWVNAEGRPPGFDVLSATDVSAVVTADSAVIVERAMYRSQPGTVFQAGHGSLGVTTPRRQWFLAEGATGDYFDMFVLLANPTPTSASVVADYLLPDGSTITKSYTVPSRSRFTVWVDREDARLADTAVSARIESDVPIVVERSMWWPGEAAKWIEAHNSPGATETSSRWALAEGSAGGENNDVTYVLIANTSVFDESVRVSIITEDGQRAEKQVTIRGTSRQNIDCIAEFPQLLGGPTQVRFATLVEAERSDASLVVERAIYSDAGARRWEAGSNVVATPLPR